MTMRRHSLAFADFAINDPRNSLTVSCTLLFAISQLFCGIVIPLSDSFVVTSKRETDHTYYLEAFLISQYIVAIVSIFYLQGYIYVIEKYHKGKNQADVRHGHHSDLDHNLMLTKDQSDIELTGNYADSDAPKVKFDLSQPNDLENNLQGDSQMIEIVNEQLITTFRNHDDLIHIQNTSTHSENSSSSSQNVENHTIVRDSEGINLYLRLGAVAFGFGVMVHDGFKIADQFRLQDITCHNELWTPKHFLHLTYTFCQTFFVFKYHRVIFYKQKSILRFILCQLAVTNICQWFKTVVYEISHELLEHEIKKAHKSKSDNNSFHHVTDESNANLTCADQLSYLLSPYLFPCAIEYSLISAAIFYKILQKVGRPKQEKPKYQHHVAEHTGFSECHRSHKGLFVGLLFFMATLVGLATFFLFKSKSSTQTLAVMVYQISEIILLFSSVCALVCAFFQMRVLSFRQLTEEEALDDNLLLVGLAGVFTYNLFLLISTVDSTLNFKDKSQWFTKILFLCKSLTEIMQSLLQVLFVLEGSRKCATTHKHIRQKPGRSVVTFLIVTNLALWLVSIFEAKRADEHMIFTNYYQKIPWSIITHTLLPLIIFFRFHSTVCLSDIWTKSYRSKIAI